MTRHAGPAATALVNSRCARTSYNQLYMLAVGAGGSVASPRLFYFVSCSPSKLAIAASSSTTSTTAVIRVWPMGCPVASYVSSYTAARAASAWCLLPQLRSWLLAAVRGVLFKLRTKVSCTYLYGSSTSSCGFTRLSGKVEVIWQNFGSLRWS